MQKRLVRKLDLERFLAQVDVPPSPSANLEQYAISPRVAATMLYIAAYANDDVVDKTVVDLGCGSGRLALGAVFLGAREVLGVDIDKASVNLALRNSLKTGLAGKVHWAAAGLDAVHGRFDTVLQNPPFGIQKRGTDRAFVVKALEMGRRVYSLHKSVHEDRSLVGRLKKANDGVVRVSSSPFLEKLIQEEGGTVKAVYALLMEIPHMFAFHTEKKHEFVADLYVIESG